MEALIIQLHTVNTSMEYREGLVRSGEEKGMEKPWRKREKNRMNRKLRLITAAVPKD